MPNVTLSVPEDLHRRMKEHPEVKWSEVIRRVLAEKIRDLERMDRIAARSALAAEDVDALDHLLKEGLVRRYTQDAEG
jgi:predicted GIY-YIG superfamily endonuclease